MAFIESLFKYQSSTRTLTKEIIFFLPNMLLQSIQLQWHEVLLSLNICINHAFHLNNQTIIPYNIFGPRKFNCPKILKKLNLVLRPFKFLRWKLLCTEFVGLKKKWIVLKKEMWMNLCNKKGVGLECCPNCVEQN